MIKIYLITGFLGAGKTTFLRHQLERNDHKIGILMNEFGKISMDTIAVQHDSVELLELKNGSIFCSCLKEHFISGLKTLILSGLDEIYIESSGLADPSDMSKVVSILDVDISGCPFDFMGTICLIDGLYFKEELKKFVSVERQVKHSHYVLINKIDLIDGDHLEEIKELILNINPKVNILTTTYGKMDLEALRFEKYYIEGEETTNREDNRPMSFVLKFNNNPEMKALESFIKDMGGYFFRVKGYVQVANLWYKIDIVNNQIDIVPYTGNVTSEFNKLVFLSSKGIKSITHLSTCAEKYLSDLFDIEM